MQRTTNRPLGLTLKTPAQKHHQQFTIVSPVPPPTAKPGLPVSGLQNKSMPGTADKNLRPKATQPKTRPGGLQFTKTPSSTNRTNTWKPNVTNSSNDASRMLRNIGKSPNRLRVFRPAFGPRLAKTPNPPIEQTYGGHNVTNSSNESHRILHNVENHQTIFRVLRPAFNPRFDQIPQPTN